MTEAIREGDIPGVQLRRRRQLTGASVATVWSWLTEPARLVLWLADEAQVELREGGALRLTRGHSPRPEVELGETVHLEAPRRWVVSFRRERWSLATRLELEITDGRTGAELSVLQSGFERLPLSEGLTVWEAYRRRWTVALDRLAMRISEAGAPASGD